MRAAFLIFDRMTALDFVSIYDPLTRLKSMGLVPAFSWSICSRGPWICDDRGLRLEANHVDQPLERFDLLVVPGGVGTRQLQHDAGFVQWLQTAAATPLKVSVCTGALLLGAAGWLKNRPATTHPRALEELARWGANVLERRIVDAGDIVTAGGVTAGLDLGLYVVGRLAGLAALEGIRRQMDYPYFDEWDGTSVRAK